MDCNKTGEGAERQTTEKPLPRGLEQVSHLFLTNTQPERSIHEKSRSASGEQTHTTPGDQSLTAVLRPCQFPARGQLVSLLRQETAALEEGMKTIDANIPCETSGNIELLALDCTNQLTIIDLDDSSNDGLLLRGIGHFDWIVRNIPTIRRMYQGQVINFSLQPRLFLVAPEFSPLSRCVTRHIRSLQIDCLKYHTVALPGGAGIFLEHIFGSGGPDRR